MRRCVQTIVSPLDPPTTLRGEPENKIGPISPVVSVLEWQIVWRGGKFRDLPGPSITTSVRAPPSDDRHSPRPLGRKSSGGAEAPANWHVWLATFRVNTRKSPLYARAKCA